MEIPTLKTSDLALLPGITSGALAPQQVKSNGNKEASEARPTNDQLQKMVADISAQISQANISINFSTYGPRNNKIAILVMDKATGEVIREIPTKELQQLYQNMDSLVGMLVNGAV